MREWTGERDAGARCEVFGKRHSRILRGLTAKEGDEISEAHYPAECGVQRSGLARPVISQPRPERGEENLIPPGMIRTSLRDEWQRAQRVARKTQRSQQRPNPFLSFGRAMPQPLQRLFTRRVSCEMQLAPR